jgi:type IV pilus assembly protein PilC
MTLYTYTAKNSEGINYDSAFDAKSKIELYAHIREEGGTLLKVQEAKKKGGGLEFLNNLLGNIKTHEKITIARNLGSMITAGLPVTRALAVMGKQTKNKKLKKLLTDLENDVSKGDTLSDAMKKYPKVFSSLFVSMVKAGEESGNLASALNIVASQMDKSYALTRKVKGALIYPGVIFTAMIAIAILMLIYMVPTLTATFEGIGAELPTSTKIIIAMSGFLVHHTLIFLISLGIFIFGMLAFLRSSIGKRVFDVVSLKLPVIGPLVKEVQSARTARTLSSLLTSGVNIVVAINVTIDVLQNHLYKQALESVREAITKGDPMSGVFNANENLYPVFVGEMVAVGEETGKISEMLLGVADFYEEEVDQKTKDLSTIIEPVLMIIIGIGVGIFAISMLAPTYSLVENF